MISHHPSDALLRLGERLQRPLPAADIRILQQLWQHDDIVIVCDRPRGLEDSPDLALRIRGALGNMLEQLCAFAPRRHDPFDRETAHELLYDWYNPTLPALAGTTEIAVPMTIWADMDSKSVTVRLRLFGEAAIHLDAVRAALVAALESGVSLRNGAIRVPFPVRTVGWDRLAGPTFDWLERSGTMLLRFLSPVIVRAGNRLQLDPASLARTAIRRAAALAPWQGVHLVVDNQALEQALAGLEVEIDIHPDQWTRYSRNAPGEARQVTAYGGSMRLLERTHALLPFMQLCQLTNIGGQCASGFGRLSLDCSVLSLN